MLILKEQKGMALVTAMLLTLISLGLVMMVLYFVTQGTMLSGFKKRYQTALEASYGGSELVTKDVIPKVITGMSFDALVANYGTIVTDHRTDTCLSDKLTKPTSSWTTVGNCSRTLDPKDNPDLTLTFPGTAVGSDFNVYTKIVNTVPGNSDTSGLELEGTGTVESSSGILTPEHFPYTYRVEVRGERKQSPDERAELSILYAY